MKGMKLKKGPILLPLLLLALGLGAYTLMNLRTVSAAESLDLGRQYLTEQKYSAAAAVFTQALTLDPGSTEARVGLSKAYAGTGDYEMARETIREIVYGQQPDEEAVRQMVQIMEGTGMTAEAVELTASLIARTDKDEYYTLREGLLAKLAAAPRSLATGTDQVLIRNGNDVLARGSNLFGQLGSDPAVLTQADNIISAQFPGTARKVFCTGRTSWVVDDVGILWAAGEDRWGQMGEGFAVTHPRSGWQKVTTAGEVAAVAGTTGRVLVLLEDGSLWTAGAEVGHTLTRVGRFPSVSQLESDGRRVLVLTTDGVLHESEAGVSNVWTVVSRNVRCFTVADGSLCWIGSNGALTRQGGGFSYPGSWRQQDGTVVPQDLFAAEFAAVGQVVLLRCADGSVQQLADDGTVRQVNVASPVTRLYGVKDALVLEHADGSASVWRAGETAPCGVTQY